MTYSLRACARALLSPKRFFRVDEIRERSSIVPAEPGIYGWWFSNELSRVPSLDGLDVSDSRMGNIRPRYNAAPSQELLVIRQNQKTGERSLDPIKWGLIPHWCSDPIGGRKPINAKAESLSHLPMFREAYALRRCIVPIDGFFEWRAIRGARAKQPYAIAMKDGSPFGLAGLWENWKNPRTGEWERTFAIITVPSNDVVGQIHNRMPAILEPKSYERWLGPETDPHDLLITYPSEPMEMWPISTRVNSPDNDDPSLLDRTGDPFNLWAPLERAPMSRKHSA
jgi:putative SOS response-associated peptidase YedK